MKRVENFIEKIFQKEKEQTPLTKGVIENDQNLIKALAHYPDQALATNEEGYNAQEMAQLLGRKECLKFLDAHKERNFYVQEKGAKGPREITEREWEKFFEVLYTPSLSFSSYTLLSAVLNIAPSWTLKEQEELGEEKRGAFVIRWIDDTVGYGLFAKRPFEEREQLGEYTGELLPLTKEHAPFSCYALYYPFRGWWHSYCIEAKNKGNCLRFVNHSETPNLQAEYLVDRGLCHTFLTTIRPIKEGEEFTIDYGKAFWKRRS